MLLHRYFHLLPICLASALPANPPNSNSLTLLPFTSSSSNPLRSDPICLQPSQEKISPSVCLERIIPAICAKLTFPFPPRGIWQWSSIPASSSSSSVIGLHGGETGGGGCAAGYYLPPTLGRGEGVPSKKDCVEKVYGGLMHCAVKGQGGGRNVVALPGERGVGNSERGGEGRGRFLLLGERVG
ncbi:MAG: hypothetical protein LQ350_005463 [Teloschistes chrysophthalmus]|nr:MAG: hypothetical protein LQ350_005463 [Niorma chrysophthalma]